LFYEDARVLLALAVAAIGAGAWIIWNYSRRVSPTEKERRRRLKVNRNLRTCEGLIMEAADSMLHYSYELRGVQYFASQDVSALRAFLPEDPNRWIGPANIKYEPRNPANSIALCEEWSGLKRREE